MLKQLDASGPLIQNLNSGLTSTAVPQNTISQATNTHPHHYQANTGPAFADFMFTKARFSTITDVYFTGMALTHDLVMQIALKSVNQPSFNFQQKLIPAQCCDSTQPQQVTSPVENLAHSQNNTQTNTQNLNHLFSNSLQGFRPTQDSNNPFNTLPSTLNTPQEANLKSKKTPPQPIQLTTAKVANNSKKPPITFLIESEIADFEEDEHNSATKPSTALGKLAQCINIPFKKEERAGWFNIWAGGRHKGKVSDFLKHQKKRYPDFFKSLQSKGYDLIHDTFEGKWGVLLSTKKSNDSDDSNNMDDNDLTLMSTTFQDLVNKHEKDVYKKICESRKQKQAVEEKISPATKLLNLFRETFKGSGIFFAFFRAKDSKENVKHYLNNSSLLCIKPPSLSLKPYLLKVKNNKPQWGVLLTKIAGASETLSALELLSNALREVQKPKKDEVTEPANKPQQTKQQKVDRKRKNIALDKDETDRLAKKPKHKSNPVEDSPPTAANTNHNHTNLVLTSGLFATKPTGSLNNSAPSSYELR